MAFEDPNDEIVIYYIISDRRRHEIRFAPDPTPSIVRFPGLTEADFISPLTFSDEGLEDTDGDEAVVGDE